MPSHEPDSAPIKVLVVDDHPVFRRGVVTLLESEPDIAAIGEVGSVDAALAWLDQARADVVLLDNNLPGGNGIPNMPHLFARQRDLQAVILTICDRDDEFLEAIRFGACGYVLKDASPERLIDSVRNAANHEVRISERMVRDFLKHQEQRNASSRSHFQSAIQVAPRERELLANLCRGYSNKEIAKALGLSPNTVRNSLQRLQERYALQNRVQLALFAKDHELN